MTGGGRRRGTVVVAVAFACMAGPVIAIWSPAASALPTTDLKSASGGPPARQLLGVSCVSPTDCFAVGETSSGHALSPVTTLTERWNGHSWTVISSPSPTGAKNSHLNVVSCTSATSCLAVGASAATRSSTVALGERWNGKSWSIVPTPDPSRTRLEGLSCTTATFCVAVGTRSTGGEGGVAKTLVERWNGRRWSLVPSPNPGAASVPVLDAVSCTSKTSCYAVGDYGRVGLPSSSTLIEQWNGKTWKIMTSPDAGAGEIFGLVSVSCPSATSCVAIGSIGTGLDSFVTLAERWNGKTWSLMPHAAGGNLYTVSCASPTNCFAAGSFDASGPSPANALVDRWDGAKLSIVATPEADRAFDVLNAVSCTSPTWCLAVGGSYSVSNNGVPTLVEHWNGTHWSIAPRPN